MLACPQRLQGFAFASLCHVVTNTDALIAASTPNRFIMQPNFQVGGGESIDVFRDAIAHAPFALIVERAVPPATHGKNAVGSIHAVSQLSCRQSGI
ncbi:hypothetical protein Mal65_54640 [Crateriforma conspicua]|nr:hypothetical protein Mal65_54640 [Crateriforma conspicua]